MGMEREEAIAEELRFCTSRTDVEKFFSKQGVSEKKSQIKLLQIAMHADEVYYTPNASIEDKYEIEIGTFVSKAWQ